MTQLTTFEKQDKFIQMWHSDFVRLFLGPLTILFKCTAWCLFRHILKNLSFKYTLTVRMKWLSQFNMALLISFFFLSRPSASVLLLLSSRAPGWMRFMLSALFSRCCEALLVESSHASATAPYFLTLAPRKVFAVQFILCPVKHQHSRVQPRVSLSIHTLSLCPGVDSLLYATLCVHHETRHLWMALIFMRQSVCGQSQRGPSLSGRRMYCAAAEGREGPHWGHTQDGTCSQIPYLTTADREIGLSWYNVIFYITFRTHGLTQNQV